jgi:hypothetical protein
VFLLLSPQPLRWLCGPHRADNQRNQKPLFMLKLRTATPRLTVRFKSSRLCTTHPAAVRLASISTRALSSGVSGTRRPTPKRFRAISNWIHCKARWAKGMTHPELIYFQIGFARRFLKKQGHEAVAFGLVGHSAHAVHPAPRHVRVPSDVSFAAAVRKRNCKACPRTLRE